MRYAICMPAYNEASGIAEFIGEIADAFSGHDFHIFVVDDCSTDGTAQVLRRLQMDGVPLAFRSRAQNLGHGPSTLEALRLGLDNSPAFVVAVDGDGQFTGPDLFRFATTLAESDVDVLEGVRLSRHDAVFRQVTSLATRLLVFSRCGKFPLDANTPVRGYRAPVLRLLLRQLPSDVMTPNLFISALSRMLPVTASQDGIRCYPRRGDEVCGSTWKAKSKRLPSRRFITFCGRATVQWFSLRNNAGTTPNLNV